MYCVFCAKELEGESRSAAPVKEKGYCCESCYKEFVEPVVAELPYKYGVLIPASMEAKVTPYEIKNKGTLLELNDLQAAVCGYIQPVRTDSRAGYLILVDEDGKLCNKAVNERATYLCKKHLMEGDCIVGDALLVVDGGENFRYLTLKSARALCDLINSMKFIDKEEEKPQGEESQTSIEKTAEKLREGEIFKINEKMFLRRFNFITSCTEADAFTNQNEIIKSAVKALFYQNEWRLNIFVLMNFGVELTEEEKEYVDVPFRSEESEVFCRAITDDLVSTPERALRALMFYTYALWWDNDSKGVWGELGDDEYSLTEEVKFIYEFLESIGYEKSEEEVLWYNGTHDVYKPVEVERNDDVSEISG